ncbi:MAG: hypothetical protein MPJ50_09360 [Pirellulales bacterium]|nr:hypothetical protein [Pirellulales bacterium]
MTNANHRRGDARRFLLGIAALFIGVGALVAWQTAVSAIQPLPLVSFASPSLPLQQSSLTDTRQQSNQPPEWVARLIRDLGSDSYARRETAGKQLQALGRESILPLEAVRESSNPEMRIRAEELLRELKLSAMWDASVVNINVHDRPVKEVFEEVARQTRNNLTLGAGTSGINDMPVDASFRRVPFWEAVDQLCAKSANHVAYFTGRRETRLGISRGLQPMPPVTYVGPLRGQILSARREFSQHMDFGQATSQQTHTFVIELRIEWEEQFHMIAHRKLPRLIEAVTDTGQVLELAAPSTEDWAVANPLNRQATFTLALTPPTLGAEKIAKLRLAWEVAAVGDFAELRIEDLATSKIYQQDEVGVTLQSRVVRPYQRQEVQLLIDRTFPSWEPSRMFYGETQVLLLDDEDKPLRLEQADWSQRSTGLKVRVRYLGATAGPPESIIIRYPRLRAKRELELEFNDIPLPRAVPN